MDLKRIFPAAIIASLLLGGCAVPVANNIQPSAASVARYDNMSDIDVVAALEKNVAAAKAADMPFLAPHYFKEAAEVLSECKNQLGNQPREILANNAARGDAILEKGRKVMEIVSYRFSRELEIRARLSALEADQLLKNEYKSAMAEFSRLVEFVEYEKPRNIDSEKEALFKSLQALEVKAVQEGALHEADAVVAELHKKGAQRHAPLTFAEAEKALKDARKKIAADPRNDKLVQELGVKAKFAANHAKQVYERVAELSKKLNISSGAGMSMGVGVGAGSNSAGVQVGGGSGSADRTTLEKVVLEEEERLLTITTSLGLADMRDQPLDKQMAEIKRAAATKGGAGQEYEARLKAAREEAHQAKAQLAAKELQLKEQAAQLAQKEAEISALKGKPSRPAAKRRTTRKAKQPAK